MPQPEPIFTPRAAYYRARPAGFRRDRWRVALVGANGEVIATSQVLKGRASVLANVAAQRGASHAELRWEA